MGNLHLREIRQPLKTWYHRVTDKLVYGLEPVKVDGAENSWALERYICGEFVLLALCQLRSNGYGIAVIEAAKVPDWFPLNSVHEFAVARHEKSVFVDAVNFVENPQEFKFWSIVSVVRLQCFDDASGRTGHQLHFVDSTTASFQVVGFFQEDGKFNPAGDVLVSRAPRQLPSEMVERRAKVERNITNQRTKSKRRLAANVEAELVSRFQFHFEGDLVRWGLLPNKLPDGQVQGAEVFFCPAYLLPYTIERIHALYSKHEGQEDAKDTQGPRNPRAGT